MVFAVDINAFHVVGAILALWALLLTFVGVRNHDFPPKGLEKVIMGISVVLVMGAIGTAIGTSTKEEPKGSETSGKPNKGGEEGSGAPSQGATPAPGTGSASGQNSSGGKPAPPGNVSQTLKLTADPTQLKFNTSTLTSKAGQVAIVMQNPSQIPHNISLEGPGGVNVHGKTVPNGGSSQVRVQVTPGKYTFYCSVPGHRQAGMEGTLTVTK